MVGKLRDLSNKAKALRALSKTRGASTFGASSDPSAMGIDPSLMRTIEEKLEEVDIVAAQAETYPVPGNPEELKVTEGDLKVKHKVVGQDSNCTRFYPLNIIIKLYFYYILLSTQGAVIIFTKRSLISPLPYFKSPNCKHYS